MLCVLFNFYINLNFSELFIRSLSFNSGPCILIVFVSTISFIASTILSTTDTYIWNFKMKSCGTWFRRDVGMCFMNWYICVPFIDFYLPVSLYQYCWHFMIIKPVSGKQILPHSDVIIEFINQQEMFKIHIELENV